MPEPSSTTGLSWRKSRASVTGECVEVAVTEDMVAIRDSKDRQGPMVTYTAKAWREFVHHLADDA